MRIGQRPGAIHDLLVQLAEQRLLELQVIDPIEIPRSLCRSELPIECDGVPGRQIGHGPRLHHVQPEREAEGAAQHPAQRAQDPSQSADGVSLPLQSGVLLQLQS